MKALFVSLFFLLFFASAAYALDERCECTDSGQNDGTYLICENVLMQFFPFHRIGKDQAHAKCEAAKAEFLKNETHVACVDPNGGLAKADLQFNSDGGTMSMTYSDGHTDVDDVHAVWITRDRNRQNGTKPVYYYRAYLNIPINRDLLLDLYPVFNDRDPENPIFDGYQAHPGIQGFVFNCTVDELL